MKIVNKTGNKSITILINIDESIQKRIETDLEFGFTERFFVAKIQDIVNGEIVKRLVIVNWKITKSKSIVLKSIKDHSLSKFYI